MAADIGLAPQRPADDRAWMRQALAWAARGARAGEVPVGAVVVAGGSCVASAHNLCESMPDATAHAERLALSAAAAALGRWRLNDCTLFVTLEPCMMCAGALLQARVGRLVYGASIRPLPGETSTGWTCGALARGGGLVVAGGVLAADSEALLATFFAARRNSGGGA